MIRPLVLDSNRPRRFYQGGARIDAFRGEATGDPDRPEEWLASTTTAFGETHVGLSAIDGQLLRDMVREDPVAWLGQEQVDRLGPDPGLLVKLLSAEQRLPIHAHPNRDFAGRWLSSRWGKTEAWIVLDAAPGSEVWLGWRDAMDPAEIRRAVDEQTVDRLLGRMNHVRVNAGDTVLVPAGTAHAIGPDLLILELQEPTDFSILLEWRGFQIDGARAGHLGLGFDVALDAVDMGAMPAGRLGELVRHAGTVAGDVGSARGAATLLPAEADPFFLAGTVVGGAAGQPAGFGVLVVNSGEGWLDREAGDPLAIRAGMALVIPAAAGAWRLRGEVMAICARPAAIS